PATVSMSERLAALHAELFAKPWSADTFREILRDTNTSGLMTLPNASPPAGQGSNSSETLLGFAFARIAADEAEVLAIGVSESHQSLGIGKALLLELVRRVKERGATRLFLEVADDNASALRLYRNVGFKIVGTRPRYYARDDGQGVDAQIMARTLDE
ncbi:MAG: ribosomal protein S18-alanine N-acetyltransferase, partial [Pseudomonadota bacterium]